MDVGEYRITGQTMLPNGRVALRLEREDYGGWKTTVDVECPEWLGIATTARALIGEGLGTFKVNSKVSMRQTPNEPQIPPSQTG